MSTHYAKHVFLLFLRVMLAALAPLGPFQNHPPPFYDVIWKVADTQTNCTMINVVGFFIREPPRFTSQQLTEQRQYNYNKMNLHTNEIIRS